MVKNYSSAPVLLHTGYLTYGNATPAWILPAGNRPENFLKIWNHLQNRPEMGTQMDLNRASSPTLNDFPEISGRFGKWFLNYSKFSGRFPGPKIRAGVAFPYYYYYYYDYYEYYYDHRLSKSNAIQDKVVLHVLLTLFQDNSHYSQMTGK